MKVFRRTLLFLSIAIFFAISVYVLAPWKSYLAKQIADALTRQGYAVSFDIVGLGLNKATVKNLSLGRDMPLVIADAVIEFTPREVLDGRIRNLTLTGLDLAVIETDEGWKLAGGDVRKKDVASSKPFDIPEILSSLPFDSLRIEQSVVRIEGRQVSARLPVTMLFTNDALTFRTAMATIMLNGEDISLPLVSLDAKRDQHRKSWNGTWQASSFSLPRNEIAANASGKGSIAVTKGLIDASGTFTSNDGKASASLTAKVDLNEPAHNLATLLSAAVPFKGGKVSTKNVTLRLPMKFTVRVDKVSIGDLIGDLTGQKITATGTMSGSVPLRIAKNGGYSFGSGTLRADGKGVISMPGDVVPGDQPQVALVRDIVKNLHYALLSASVLGMPDGGMTVRLSLEGNNPEVLDGRPVKLNLNLTGDILDIVQQNIMLFKSPETLLKQDLR